MAHTLSENKVLQNSRHPFITVSSILIPLSSIHFFSIHPLILFSVFYPSIHPPHRSIHPPPINPHPPTPHQSTPTHPPSIHSPTHPATLLLLPNTRPLVLRDGVGERRRTLPTSLKGQKILRRQNSVGVAFVFFFFFEKYFFEK